MMKSILPIVIGVVAVTAILAVIVWVGIGEGCKAGADWSICTTRLYP